MFSVPSSESHLNLHLLADACSAQPITPQKLQAPPTVQAPMSSTVATAAARFSDPLTPGEKQDSKPKKFLGERSFECEPTTAKPISTVFFHKVVFTSSQQAPESKAKPRKPRSRKKNPSSQGKLTPKIAKPIGAPFIGKVALSSLTAKPEPKSLQRTPLAPISKHPKTAAALQWHPLPVPPASSLSTPSATTPILPPFASILGPMDRETFPAVIPIPPALRSRWYSVDSTTGTSG